VETSIGLDRMFLAVMSAAYDEEKLEDGSERVVLRIPPALAPVKAAILPLMNKDGLGEKAEQIFNELKFDFNVQYDAKDAIGRRYRRQDAVGTPFCITIDHQTLEDDTVTIRERDSMEQKRVPTGELSRLLDQQVNIKHLLKKI
ncbi:MAG: His/Gly/Thr/Pro-type tRNA ligase C-terminal domain-containing protein, partial [Cyclobacteriaceae bacterium]|nr:His/Gly/Thr/Pro-type tRNA ligase C-terminal domain-containing protein [Cyclobacteriaceae bacterium]